MSYRALMTNRGVRGAFGLVVVLAVAFGATRFWEYGRHNAGVDFYQFWLVGRAAAAPETGSIYERSEQLRIAGESLARAHSDPEAGRLFVAAEAREEIEVFSTPLLYTAFGALATGDYETDYRRYRMLIQTLTILALAVLGRAVGFGMLKTMALLAVVLIAFEPLYADLRVLNVNQLQLALVALYFALRRWADDPFDDLLGGAVLALACLFKPNLAPAAALLAVYWAVDRRWRTLAGHAAGGVVGTALALAATRFHFGGFVAWRGWAEALRGIPDAWIPVEIGNFSLAAVVQERTGLALSVALTIGLFAIAVAILAWRMRRSDGGGGFGGVIAPADERDLRVFAVGILVYLLGAGLVWQHYYLLTLPAFYLAAVPSSGRNLAAWRWALLALAFLPHVADDRVRHLLASGPHVFALEVALGALVLLGLLLSDRALGVAEVE